LEKAKGARYRVKGERKKIKTWCSWIGGEKALVVVD